MCYRTILGGKDPHDQERSGITCCRNQDEIEESKRRKYAQRADAICDTIKIITILIAALLFIGIIICLIVKTIAEARMYWKAANVGINDINNLVKILSQNIDKL